jgi:hypothetical protein
MAQTSEDMLHRETILDHHALLVKEEEPLGLRSCEELKEVIFHHFGIRKHEMYVYRSVPNPFVIIFSEQHAKDEVFAAGRLIDGAVELRFVAWELDDFGERLIILYHVRLSIEGIPQHAWNREMADKVLCDEAMIHHVEERTRKKIDHHTFQCWAFSKDPFRIPQIVFLTFVKNEIEGHRDAQVHFVRHAHVFKVLIHIVVVEDLMFYHYPRQELIDDGKIPRREFVWRMGHPDEGAYPVTRLCDSGVEDRRHQRDDDDEDCEQKRPRACSIMRRISSWMEGRSKGRNRSVEGHRGSDWYRGESS